MEKLNPDGSHQSKIISIHAGECYPYYSIDSDPEDYQKQQEITMKEYTELMKAYEDFRIYQIRLREILTSHATVKDSSELNVGESDNE